ncbi:MAG: exo-alpha-sialidase [Paenibacillus sp.]|nr:exo-alpha-sialidase [Paenibacillus sp.]
MTKQQRSSLPTGWEPVRAADQVMDQLIPICEPSVKGAHDADFVIAGGKAYVVYEANDIQPGEAASWTFVYAVMSIIDLQTNTVERIIRFAESEQAYDNETLPVGACFVPRIIRKDANTLRCFFVSEHPEVREGQTWYIDYRIDQTKFDTCIYKAKLKTPEGLFDMQPYVFYRYASDRGYTGKAKNFGLYLVDSFKSFENRTYAVLNNYPIGQNGLTVLNEQMDTFEMIGVFHEPGHMRLTEASVNRLPDGTWRAITRCDNGDCNYAFAESRDGIQWTPHKQRPPVVAGSNSKPTFDRFNGLYYLGWQDAEKVGEVGRSIFNLDISEDGEHWERKYRFESEKSFQYPVFKQADGAVYVAVTRGDHSASRKEYIAFGKLEDL